LANFHAEKSGHDQFEESTEEVRSLSLISTMHTHLHQIKPLTEEEKKQKLEELRVKLAEKRAVKSAKEAEENKANEAIRRKAGKDVTKLKEDMKAKEAIKAAEQARKGVCVC
jgi:HD-like signal output (HDOD) protein